MRVCVLGVGLLTVAVDGHGGLFIPAARNADDRDLPQFAGGKSPDTPCT